MKVENLESLKVINNYVLIKPDPGYDKITLKNGLVLFLNTDYAREQHAVTSGIVVKVPDSLTYYEENGLYNLDFLTTQELQVGDRIVYHYIQAMDNIKQNRYVEHNGEVYFMIYYDKIFCAIRNEEVIPINGIVIVEASGKEKEVAKSHIYMPDIFIKQPSEIYGTIRYIGSPLMGYNDYQGYGADWDNFKVGDNILFRKVDSVPLQYPLHQVVDKDKILYRMHRRDILWKYDDMIETLTKYQKEQVA